MKNNPLRLVICTFFSFLLCISLSLTASALVVKSTVLNKNFLLDQLSISGYHVKATDYAKKSISELAFVGGVPAEIFDSIITSERVNLDTYRLFSAAYEGEQYSIDTEALENEFINVIQNYASENSMEITEETQSNIQHLAEQCVQAYLDCINIAGLNTVIGALRQPVSFMSLALIGSAFIAVFSIVMLYLTNKYKHKFFRYIFYALGGATLILSVIPGYFLLAKPYEKLNISPDYLHAFINSYINDTLKSFLGVAAVFLVLVIGVFILISFFKKRAVKKGIDERRRSSMV